MSSTTVLSEPPGARVFVKGQFVGTTPVRLTLEKENYTIRLEKDGYEPLVDHLGLVTGGAGQIFAGPGRLLFPDAKYGFRDSYLFRLSPIRVENDPGC